MKRERPQKGEPHLCLITDEIDLLVNVRAWATLHNRAHPTDYDRPPGGGSSLTRGEVRLVTDAAHESTSLHDFGVSITYLRPAQSLRFICQFGYDVVALRPRRR